MQELEATLFDFTFPLNRPVRKTLATPLPAKITIGEYSRDDQVLKSSWVVRTLTGGLGKNYGDYPQDANRYYFGTLSALYNRKVTLAQAVTHADELGPADTMIDFNEVLYYAVGNQIYRFNTSTNTKTAVATATATSSDAAVYFGKLYFLNTNDLVEYDGNTDTWTTYSGAGGVALVGWQDKLFRLDVNGGMWWTVQPIGPSSWTQNGQVPLLPGYAQQLLVYFDNTGESCIYAATKVGAWAYDFDTGRFLQTGLSYPPTRSSGKRAATWRSEYYSPTGQEEYKFNNQTVQITGPNRDDGLPINYRGDIARIISGHAFRYMCINGPDPDNPFDPNTPVEGIFGGKFDRTAFFDPTQINGVVLQSPGTAWHVLYVDPNVGSGFGSGLVATVDGKHRFFWSSGSGLYYVDAPTSMHNPLQDPTTNYLDSGYLDTPWFDSGWSELSKLAITLELKAHQCSPTETITIWCAWDENETWEKLTEVTADGEYSIPFGKHGRIFKSVKLRLEMARGDDSTKTPVFDGLVLTFTRQPAKRWTYDLEIIVPAEYGRYSADDLQRQLNDITNSSFVGELVYQMDNGDPVSKWVEVTGARVVEQVGQDKRGLWQVTLAEVN